MPAASTTARTEPPAMTPVPCEAGLSMTVARAELLDHLVRDGGADERHPDEVLLGVLDALADGLGHLAGLAQAGADVAVAVADDDDRAEAEAAAALDDLGHAVDLDDPLFEGQLVGIDAVPSGLLS